MMAIDGLVLDVADTPANDEEFGRSGNHETPGPFPQVLSTGRPAALPSDEFGD